MAPTEIKETAALPEQALAAALTEQEAARRYAAGQRNYDDTRSGRSSLGIVVENLCTFFNLVWAIVTVVLVLLHSYTNLTFLAVVVPNILIAIIQQLRAKRTVEKLSVTTDPRAIVLRDGRLIEIPADDIVLGDVMRIEMGHQILSDAEVLSGVGEVNESMLTGESNAIRKEAGARLMAGSFLVSGCVYARVTAVGKDNYVHKIENAAKRFKKPVSHLFRDLNRLIRYIGILLVLLPVPLYFVCYLSNGHNSPSAVAKTCGAIIGMIPAGIYLLVTLTLTLSVISLARKHTLVQDMYSIEMLASADVVCLDKTGTVTDGTMQVTAVEPLGDATEEQITAIMAMLEGAEESQNNTSRALTERFGRREVSCRERIPFSSTRKYSAADFGGEGVYAIGAPHFVPCPVSPALEQRIHEHAVCAERVLLLVRLTALSERGEAIAMIAISDRIRPNAAETIRRFQEQGVTVRLISGDHAETVSAIAARVGVTGAERYLSCESVSDEELVACCEDYAVFGRVTPEQKVLLVRTLRQRGHTVAMTGDGVNDTLALKESDCAIAMADGSEVARKVAQIVLMNSDFGTLPDVVREGRRCINNVRMSAVLFLMKTFFTIFLSLFAICTVSAYPFEPKQFSLLELFIIGFASLALAVEPNDKRIEGSFIRTVLWRSAPNALALFVPTGVLLLLHKLGSPLVPTLECRNAIAVFGVLLVGYINLLFLCRPYTRWRVGVAAAVLLLTAGALPLTIFLLNDMMILRPAFTQPVFLLVFLLLSGVFATLLHLARLLVGYLVSRRASRAQG